MGFEPTTLRDLVGCSNHWATGDSMVNKSQFMGLDWNRNTQLHDFVLKTCLLAIGIWGIVFCEEMVPDRAGVGLCLYPY